jgi:hypothetical protein
MQSIPCVRIPSNPIQTAPTAGVRHDAAGSHPAAKQSLVRVESRTAPTQTLNLTFLYVTVSTLNPTVGIVVTLWFSLSLYRIAMACQPRQPVDPPHIRTRTTGRTVRWEMDAS